MASSVPKLSRTQSGAVELHPRQPIGYLRILLRGENGSIRLTWKNKNQDI